eukprot:7389440-Prymnesium_polylepis.2
MGAEGTQPERQNSAERPPLDKERQRAHQRAGHDAGRGKQTSETNSDCADALPRESRAETRKERVREDEIQSEKGRTRGEQHRAERMHAEPARTWKARASVPRENTRTDQPQNRRSNHEHGRNTEQENRQPFGEFHPPTVPKGSAVRSATVTPVGRTKGKESSGDSADRRKHKQYGRNQAARNGNEHSSRRALTHGHTARHSRAARPHAETLSQI